jgi:hypothetical protein
MERQQHEIAPPRQEFETLRREYDVRRQAALRTAGGAPASLEPARPMRRGWFFGWRFLGEAAARVVRPGALNS